MLPRLALCDLAFCSTGAAFDGALGDGAGGDGGASAPLGAVTIYAESPETEQLARALPPTAALFWCAEHEQLAFEVRARAPRRARARARRALGSSFPPPSLAARPPPKTRALSPSR